MDERYKNVLLIIAAVVGIYFIVFYLFPPILQVLGVALVLVVKLLLFAAALIGLYVILKFIVNYMRKES